MNNISKWMWVRLLLTVFFLALIAGANIYAWRWEILAFCLPYFAVAFIVFFVWLVLKDMGLPRSRGEEV